MQLYDCKVRLAGSVLNEIRKKDVTAAEIILLREIHGGSDAVLDVVATRMDKRSHAGERERLRGLYANPSDMSSEQHAKKIAMMRNLFGHDTMDLPVKLPGDIPQAPEPDVPVRTMVDDPTA